jgi:hypothetical protein
VELGDALTAARPEIDSGQNVRLAIHNPETSDAPPGRFADGPREPRRRAPEIPGPVSGTMSLSADSLAPGFSSATTWSGRGADPPREVKR